MVQLSLIHGHMIPYDPHPIVEQAWLVSGNEGWGSKLAIMKKIPINEFIEVPDGIIIDDGGLRVLNDPRVVPMEKMKIRGRITAKLFTKIFLVIGKKARIRIYYTKILLEAKIVIIIRLFNFQTLWNQMWMEKQIKLCGCSKIQS